MAIYLQDIKKILTYNCRASKGETLSPNEALSMKKDSRVSQKKGLTVLSSTDRFSFSCHPKVTCFTQCCRNITIFLSPYDIIRMKNALQIPSEQFLNDYTLTVLGDLGLPVVLLKMGDNQEKSCPFVTPRGCHIYPNRPWSCRIYPLQPESTAITEKIKKEYYSIMDVSFCFGLLEDKTSEIADWKKSQGLLIYQEMEKDFKKIMTNSQLAGQKITNKKIREMFYMACYDIDRFRRFVFESKFLKIYEIDSAIVKKIKDDDVELFKLAMRWLEHGMIGQKVLKIKPQVIKAKKQDLGIQ